MNMHIRGPIDGMSGRRAGTGLNEKLMCHARVSTTVDVNIM